MEEQTATTQPEEVKQAEEPFKMENYLIETEVEPGFYISKGKKKRSKDIDELHEIVYEGTVAELKELLREGADPNVKNPRNETPLHVAMAHGKTWAIEPLIRAGANPNKMPYHGLTPLMLAIMNKQPLCVQRLVDVCQRHSIPLDVNKAHLLGETALHYAAAVGDCRSIQLLVDCGADVNPQGIDGRTPLALAETNNQKRAAKLLKQLGGVIKTITVVQHTPKGKLPEFVKDGNVDDETLIATEDKYGGAVWPGKIVEVFYTGKKPRVGMATEVIVCFKKDFHFEEKATYMRGLISWVADDFKQFKCTVNLVDEHDGLIPELEGEWEATLKFDSNIIKKVPCPWTLDGLVKLENPELSMDKIFLKELERIRKEGYRVMPQEPEPLWVLKGTDQLQEELLAARMNEQGPKSEETEAAIGEAEDALDEMYGDEDLPPKEVIKVEVDTKANRIKYYAEDGDTKIIEDNNISQVVDVLIQQNDMLRKKGLGAEFFVDGKNIYDKPQPQQKRPVTARR